MAKQHSDQICKPSPAIIYSKAQMDEKAIKHGKKYQQRRLIKRWHQFIESSFNFEQANYESGQQSEKHAD
ncbi:MAG: hypothetical protein WCI51_12845 [Lentisphaerota bacterium]